MSVNAIILNENQSTNIITAIFMIIYRIRTIGVSISKLLMHRARSSFTHFHCIYAYEA